MLVCVSTSEKVWRSLCVREILHTHSRYGTLKSHNRLWMADEVKVNANKLNFNHCGRLLPNRLWNDTKQRDDIIADIYGQTD